MKKTELLNTLKNQVANTTKSTRKDIINVVYNLCKKHIKDNAEIFGIEPTRDNNGVNLGSTVEAVVHSLFRNKLEKSDSKKGYDVKIKGQKVEVKFTTSDAYAHPINEQAVVDYYIIIAYTKADGGVVYKIPYEKRNDILVNNQNRIYANQKAKYLDRDLTERVFG